MHNLDDQDEDGPDEAAIEALKDEMREWFYLNFEDPAHHCPYESREGGYQWIYGGPCDAKEELEQKYGSKVPYEVIEALADELEGECPQWSPIVDESDFYGDYLDDDEIMHFIPADKLSEHLANVLQLLSVEIPEPLRNKYHQMLYANVIGAMEAYLCDRFMKIVLSDSDKLRKFVSTTPDFKKEKLPLSEIFDIYDGLQDMVKTRLVDMIWHRLDVVSEMYKSTLCVEFPNMGAISRAIRIRHDIAHRNGFTKNGDEVKILVTDLDDLVSSVLELAGHIEKQLAASKSL